MDFEPIGNISNECPYCSFILKDRPSRKKKCPNCENYIYVRVRPLDRKKVLLTKEQSDELEKQWEKYNFEKYTDPELKLEIERTRQQLLVKFGHEPSEHDVYWSIYNKELVEHSRNGDWGLYRNTRNKMAEQLERENNISQALDTYIEVSYIDSNGPRNMGGVNDSYILNKYPPFDPSRGSQAPGIVYNINILSKKLSITESNLQLKYFAISKSIKSELNLHITPEDAWKQFRKYLSQS